MKKLEIGKENMKPIKKQFMMVTASLALFSFAGFSATTASANEVEWTARTVEQVKQDVKTDDKGVQEYTIKWGDTLSVISEATGASLDTLVQVNEIQDANLIYPGTVLRFSADQKEVTVDNGTEQHSYRVQNNNEVKEVETTEATTQARERTPAANTNFHLPHLTQQNPSHRKSTRIPNSDIANVDWWLYPPFLPSRATKTNQPYTLFVKSASSQLYVINITRNSRAATCRKPRVVPLFVACAFALSCNE